MVFIVLLHGHVYVLLFANVHAKQKGVYQWQRILYQHYWVTCLLPFLLFPKLFSAVTAHQSDDCAMLYERKTMLQHMRVDAGHYRLCYSMPAVDS